MAEKPVWERVGLTQEEYGKIVTILGREPNQVELEMFGLMWSEHCSYKTSRRHLKKLPTTGQRILQGPGENAGVVDVGDGWGVAFKIESHNHPSAVEPFQGAATGVGGILRDIFTMGARPIAALDSLRFGPLNEARGKFLFGGVVAGIAHYGNCFGVPTVGGEVYFEDCYRENPLVNAMCVGLVRTDRIIRGRADGIGNAIFLVGARTGRDGIHGASLLASQELNSATEEQRPAVQVGDPFTEKLLLEACLELADSGAVIGIQDLGAAGLTSSSSEMAGRSGVGIELDVSLVPRREEGMEPWEVMISESQERMLVCVAAGREDEVREIFEKWDLNAALIGRVTGDGMLRVKDGDRMVAEIPAAALAQEAPSYDRPTRRPAYLDELKEITAADLPDQRPPEEALLRLLAHPNIASKEAVYRQYDHMVQTNTAVLPGSDAAVLRLRGSGRGIALATDGNGRLTYLDPKQGAAMAVAEAARNVVCSGAEPAAITNCLNFGNPEKPEIMWQFVTALEGMSEASLALNTPVTGGNVSFYNDTDGRSIYPTPVIGMVGVLESIDHRTTQWFKGEGEAIILLGGTGSPRLGGSQYLALVRGDAHAALPPLDLELEAAVQRTCLAAIRRGWVSSAHDCSDGGLAVALAECCFTGPRLVGASVELTGDDRADGLLFNEAPSRIIVSTPADLADQLLSLAREHGVPAQVIGRTGSDRLSVRVNHRCVIDRPVAELARIWREAIPCLTSE